MGGLYLEQLRRKRAEDEHRRILDENGGYDTSPADQEVEDLTNRFLGRSSTGNVRDTLNPRFRAAMSGAHSYAASAPSAPSTDDGPGPVRQVWNTVTAPLKAIAGLTGTSLVHALGIRAMFPEAYASAARELETGITGGAPRELGLMEQAEALPGLGDVVAQSIPEDSTVGRIARPVARLGLNIAGDPTTYLAGAGLATKAPRLAQFAGRLGLAEGLAYTPELVEGVTGATGRSIEELRAGRYQEAAESGAGALLTAGMGILVARGVLSEARAAGIMERSAARSLGEPPPPKTAAEVAEEQATQPLTQPRAEVPAPAPTPTRRPAEAAPPLEEVAPPPAQAVPEGVPEAGPTVAPEPAVPTQVEPPALTPPLTPIPGSERIKVERSEANAQKLNEIVSGRASPGQYLTKRDLIDAGLVTKKQAKDHSLEALMDALGGTQLRSQLEHTPGLGFRVKPAVEKAGPGPGPGPDVAARSSVEEAPIPPAELAAPTGAEAAAPTATPGEPIVPPIEPPVVPPPSVAAQAAQTPPARTQAGPADFIAGSGLGDRIVSLYQQGHSYREIAELLTEHEPLVSRAADAYNRSLPRGSRAWQKTTAQNSPAPYIERAAQMIVHAQGLSRTGLAKLPLEELESQLAHMRDVAALDKRLGTEKADHAKLNAIEEELKRRRAREEPQASLAFKGQGDNAGISPLRVLKTLYPERYGEKVEQERARIEPIRDRAGLQRAVEALEQIHTVRDRIPPDHPLHAMASELEDAIEGAARRGFERPPRPEGASLTPATEPIPARTPQPRTEASGQALVRWMKEMGVPAEKFLPRAEQDLGKPIERATPDELNLVLTLAEKNPLAYGAEPSKLDPNITTQATRRLVGGTEHLSEAPAGEFRYHPGSPAGRAQEYARDIEARHGIPAEQNLQDTLMSWISGLSKDDRRHLSQAAGRVETLAEKRYAHADELERTGKTTEASEYRAKTAELIQNISKRAHVSYESAKNIRRLLLGETDEVKARGELEKLLKRNLTNRRKDYQRLEGKRLRPIEDMVVESAAEGLDPEEAARLSIRPTVEAKIENAKLDIPTRPHDVDPAAWRERVQSEPERETLDRYRSSLAFLTDQWSKGRDVKAGRAGQPWMAPLRQIADDLGISRGKKLGAEDLIGAIGRKLQSAKPSAASDLLSESLVSQKGPAWSKALASGIRVGDGSSGVVVADLERDAGNLIRPLAQHGAPLADALARATQDVVSTLEVPGRLRALIASPQLEGVRMGDDILLNPLHAWRAAESRVAPTLEGVARADALNHAAAESLVDTLVHEVAHAKARHDAASGDLTFIDSYSRSMRELGPAYGDVVRTVRDGIEPMSARLQEMMPEYRSLVEGERGRRAEREVSRARGGLGVAEDRSVARPDARPGESVPARETGSGGDTRGALGRGDAGPRPIRPIPPGGPRPRSEPSAPAAHREGAAESAATRAGAARGEGSEGGARGVGQADRGAEEPHGSLTDAILPASVHEARIRNAQETVGRAFAHNLARYTGHPEEAERILTRIAEVDALPDAEKLKLLHAKPGGEHDIGYNLEKLPIESMSDEQKAAVAHTLLLRNSEFSRSKPMTWDRMDADGRALLDAYTPEEFITKAKAAGLKTEADFALMKSVAATFSQEFDASRGALRAAEIKGDPLAITAAKDALASSWARQMDAIFTLVPERTRVARILGSMRMMAHPLTAEESFKARFMGAMRAARIKDQPAHNLYSLLQDTISQGPSGDWSQFTRAFREATQSSKFDKFLEFWKAGLLGWPTQIANIGTNMLFRGLRDTEHTASILGDRFFSGLTGTPRKKFVGEIGGRMLGARHAYAEAFSSLKDDLLEIARLRPANLQKRMERGTFMDEPDVRQLYGAIGGRTGEFIRIPFKLLDSFDNFFKHIARTQEFGAQSNRLAHDVAFRSPGESVQHATARIFQEIRTAAQSPISNYKMFKKYETAIRSGRDAANVDTYQKALPDSIRKLQQAATAHPATQLLVPFWKTPYNILTEAVKRTPMGAAWAIDQFRRGKIDDAKFVEQMISSAIGTTAMALAAEAAVSGTITGGGPTDPKEAELLKRTGWQPRSLKIGDNYYSYQRLAPFSIVLGMAADLGEAWRRKDIDTASELMQKGVASLSDNVFDQTFVSGIDSLMKILTDPQKQGLSALRQLQSSLVPNIVGVVPFAHAARAADPYYRETEALTLSPFKAQIPGLSQTLQPQRTPTGEIRERKGSPLERMLSPIQRSEVQEGPIPEAAAEVARLGVSLSSPPLYFRVGQDRVYYTPDEREEIAAAQTKAMEKVAALVRRTDYQRLPDNEMVATSGQTTKRDAVMQIVNRYRRPIVERLNRQAIHRAKDETRTRTVSR